MPYECKILADSINQHGDRLTTFEITYPRFVHSEFMTHRMFSRNAASSRAIPIKKMIQNVIDDPVMPVWWGKNQAGMQANEQLEGDALFWAKEQWLIARDSAVENVETLSHANINLHKQIANRLLEPWMWITVIVTATEYENFFHLRCHPDAQPEIRKIADMMQEIYRTYTPKLIIPDDEAIPWHLPLVRWDDLEQWLVDELSIHDLIKISVGRCARVSYLTHDGKRDPQADIDLHDRLLESNHFSPFEHVATPIDAAGRQSGNFYGWRQYRKTLPGENFK